jgi:uncharacterized protein (DUF3084 family)
MDMQAVIKQLQETAVVMAGIQARQAEVLKAHAEWLEQNERWMTKHREAVERHEQMMARHEQMMAEMEDKLNGLIGFVDDMVRRPKDGEGR